MNNQLYITTIDLIQNSLYAGIFQVGCVANKQCHYIEIQGLGYFVNMCFCEL